MTQPNIWPFSDESPGIPEGLNANLNFEGCDSEDETTTAEEREAEGFDVPDEFGE